MIGTKAVWAVLGAAVLGASGCAAQHRMESDMAQTSDEAAPTYASTAEAIVATIRAHHYNPAELQAPPYAAVEAQILALGNTAKSDEEFLTGFRQIWRDGPFSHVNLNLARGSVEQMVEHLDNLAAGPDAVQLEWRGDNAILTVNTMMGTDTITAITTAFEEVEARGAAKLIIDLRANGGGAFAIRPLIGHMVREPFDAGVFVAQKWNAQHTAPPTREEVEAFAPWQGWSVRAFWDDAQSDPLVRVQLAPMVPVYDGPAYVLTSARTASAAELAADALQASGRALVIGERTSGEMLSQRPYDIEGKFHLFLPIADYFSLKTGRIEGVGVNPDIAAPAEDAMGIALAR